jgi:hypothetical protein
MNNIEEATRIAADVRFGIRARELADRQATGRAIEPIVSELAILRRQEQERASQLVRMAGLGRQIGDAAAVGKPIDHLVLGLLELRKRELV